MPTICVESLSKTKTLVSQNGDDLYGIRWVIKTCLNSAPRVTVFPWNRWEVRWQPWAKSSVCELIGILKWASAPHSALRNCGRIAQLFRPLLGSSAVLIYRAWTKIQTRDWQLSQTPEPLHLLDGLSTVHRTSPHDIAPLSVCRFWRLQTFDHHMLDL